MHPRVRSQYKDFINLGKQHSPWPMSVVREKIKKEFFKNTELNPGTREWKIALAWGRYKLKENQDLIELHKFRAMKKRYDWEEITPNPCPQPGSGANFPSSVKPKL